MDLGQRKAAFRGLKRLLKLYAKSKIGMAGLAIILFYLILSTFAGFFAPNAPVNNRVAASYDLPSWAVVFPQYGSTPVDSLPVAANGFNSQGDLSAWSINGANLTTTLSPGVSPPSPKVSGSLSVNSTVRGTSTLQADDPNLPGGETFFAMSQPFHFSGTVPQSFSASTTLQVRSMNNLSIVYVNFLIVTPDGVNHTISSVKGTLLATTVQVFPRQLGQWTPVEIDSVMLPASGITDFQGKANPNSVLFNRTGTFSLILQLRGVPIEGTAQQKLSVYIASVKLHLAGGAYGPLGTDNQGNDVWSQLVWGGRISLTVGILSGIGAVAFGALAGIAGGYIGGLFDDVLGRLTDFVLVLPFLPLLIVVVSIISQDPFLAQTAYVWIILLFIVISWPGIARIIRAQVLSVKERQYVEASRAVGGGTPHILRKHILPNVLGLVYSQMALNVAGFILLEAAIDFLGVNPTSTTIATWGTMLENALPFAVGDAAASHVWWWFLPPGISIAALSLAFVLVGYALDSIFNPRLRAR